MLLNKSKINNIIDEEKSIAQIALSKSKTRNQIYELINDRPAINQKEMKRIISISKSILAYHLTILEQLNLIFVIKKGWKRYYFPYDDLTLYLNDKKHQEIIK